MERGPITPELLKKYAAGHCTDTERRLVEAWLDASETESGEGLQGMDEGALKQRLWSAVAPEQVRRQPFRTWRPWAAVIAIGLSLSLLLYQQLGNRPEDGSSLRMQALNAAPGKQLTATLPDGSTVRLNAGSHLAFADPFDQRTLRLEGEAHFDVKRSPGRPFVVHTRHGTVEVLGTSFAVQAYPEDAHTQVAVSTGRVRCTATDGGEPIDLQREQGVAFDQRHLGTVATVPAAEIASWTDNVLVFNEDTLASIALKLERWFAIRVHIASDLRPRDRFRGKFRNPSLSQIMDEISHGLNLQYRLKGHDLYIEKSGTSSPNAVPDYSLKPNSDFNSQQKYAKYHKT